MRIIWIAPLVAVFGCAHQNEEAAESTQAPVAQATAPASSEMTTATKPQEVASAKPAQLACAPIKVHFALDSDQLYDSEKPLLDVTAQCLSSNNEQRVTVVGNADERGSEAYNQELGQRRANTVAQYLQGKGAAPAQIEAVISHGEDSPICQESDLKCWQLNRRTAIRESCHM
jgi:peptidoglycan-associated lipoprotein